MSYKLLTEKIDQHRIDEVEAERHRGKEISWMDVSLGTHRVSYNTFTLYHKRREAGSSLMDLTMYPNPGTQLINLDQEDLDYLYDKYYPRVAEEVTKEKERKKEELIKKADKLRKEVEKLNNEIIKLEE